MFSKSGDLELTERSEGCFLNDSSRRWTDDELVFIDINRPHPKPVSCSRRRRKKSRSGFRLLTALAFLCLCLALLAVLAVKARGFQQMVWPWNSAVKEEEGIETFLNGRRTQQEYMAELIELRELNQEARDFVEDYPNRENYKSQPVDLSGDYTAGEVPLLMQWDKRWGYDSYGDNLIALAGCGPVCLNMAYLYFTGDVNVNPREMAKFAYENGYYTKEGTNWSLWTEGVKKLGLSGEMLTLSERAMKDALDNGGLIVCSMAPGDFTTTGHFILLTGYDEKGFFVNDPNRHSNSEKRWEFDTLQYQIKNLWGIYP